MQKRDKIEGRGRGEGLTAVSSLVCFSDLVHENAMLYGSALRVVWGREHMYTLTPKGDSRVGVAYLP